MREKVEDRREERKGCTKKQNHTQPTHSPLFPSSTMDLLSDVLEAADGDQLAEFLGRVPSITKIALVSVHGFFAQANVLGKPDTGGQVVYILDQTRALEAEMKQRLAAAGVAAVPKIVILTRLIPDAGNTTCDVRLEKVAGCDHAVILRVPFRNGGGVVRQWISRFDIWPYLEQFSVDAAAEVAAELGGKPALVVGNYSDGNCVASLLANHYNCPSFSIAHALEMTKYSDMWQWSSPQYTKMHADVQITGETWRVGVRPILRSFNHLAHFQPPFSPTLYHLFLFSRPARHGPRRLHHHVHVPRDCRQKRVRHRRRARVGGPV